jgi:predicted metal-dependent hydrolase
VETLWSADEWEPVDGPGRVPTLRAPAESEAERVADMAVEVVRSPKRRKSVSARIVDGRIVIRMPQWMTKAQEREYVESLVAKLVRQHTAKAVDLPARARELARRYDLPEPTSIRFVSNQSSRWGSCTPSTGEIRISDRIGGFPGWVLDAVIVHELAHLVELGHGPEFQALADRYPRQERAYGFLLAMQLTDDEVES